MWIKMEIENNFRVWEYKCMTSTDISDILVCNQGGKPKVLYVKVNDVLEEEESFF